MTTACNRASGWWFTVARYRAGDLKDPEKIFEPFYSTKRGGIGAEGMGLGLSISYGLVQSFGGNIRGTNAGNGAEFTVELDRWSLPVHRLPLDNRLNDGPNNGMKAGMTRNRVLLVDDDAAVREALGQTLELADL